jgi:hypothetical protein
MLLLQTHTQEFISEAQKLAVVIQGERLSTYMCYRRLNMLASQKVQNRKQNEQLGGSQKLENRKVSA